MSEARDALRAKLLATRAVTTRKLTFFGEEIELRQMTLADVMKARDNPDEQLRLTDILIQYAYVPGTDEKVFEEGDTEVLLQQPFGQDFINLSNALTDLTQVNFTEQKSASTPTS